MGTEQWQDEFDEGVGSMPGADIGAPSRSVTSCSKNIFDLTTRYNSGVAEQTTEREQSWTIGLSATY